MIKGPMEETEKEDAPPKPLQQKEDDEPDTKLANL